MSLHDFTDIHKPEGLAPRELPHSIELEQAVIGAVLVDNKQYERVCDLISAEHFYDPLHMQLMVLIGNAVSDNRLANPLTLRAFVDGLPLVNETLTVPQYMTRLAVNAASPHQIAAYCKSIFDLSARRQIIEAANDLVEAAFDASPDVPASELISTAEQRLFELGERSSTAGKGAELKDAVSAALTMVADAYTAGGNMAGISTGLIDLDAKLGGLQPSDLLIIGGRPSMGKTALALNIAYNAAKEHVSRDGIVGPLGHVHFFSLEMSKEQLALRLIGETSEVGADALRRGAISEQQFRNVIDKSRVVAAGSMTIDDAGGITLARLASRARRVKRQRNTALIIIDYLQLLSGAANKRGQNRVQEITDITTGLKALAKELGVPIIALSQLSRKLEDRADKRPQLADLRESGSIEQDADVVMFVYRDEYYVEREQPDENDPLKYAEWSQRMERAHGKAEVIIGKQRHGPVGTVMVSFESKFTRFSNLAGGNHGR